MRNPIQIIRLVFSFFRLVGNPNQLTAVIQLNDALLKTSTSQERAQWVEGLSKLPLANHARLGRIQLGKIDLVELAKLPETTLGGAYARFMTQNGLTAESLSPEHLGQSDIEFFMTHIYETHDIWHVISGFQANTIGEAGLLTFTLTQYVSHAAPLLIAAILLHATIYRPDLIPQVFASIAEGWKLGKNARNLVGQDWKSHWNESLQEIREAHNVLC